MISQHDAVEKKLVRMHIIMYKSAWGLSVYATSHLTREYKKIAASMLRKNIRDPVKKKLPGQIGEGRCCYCLELSNKRPLFLLHLT